MNVWATDMIEATLPQKQVSGLMLLGLDCQLVQQLCPMGIHLCNDTMQTTLTGALGAPYEP